MISNKRPLLPFLSICFWGCSTNPIPKPHPLVEYQHPFVHAQYQTKPTTVTQVALDNDSDVAQIIVEPEYVFWTNSPKSLLEPQVQPNDEPVSEQPVAAQTPTNDTEIQPESTIAQPVMVKIYCDEANEQPCGELAMCNHEPCNEHHKEVYQCADHKCTPLYVVNKDNECSKSYSTANPDCSGKGDAHCAKHPELNHCNTRLPSE